MGERSGIFAAPDMGDNTVAAKVITAAHYSDIGHERFGSGQGEGTAGVEGFEGVDFGGVVQAYNRQGMWWAGLIIIWLVVLPLPLLLLLWWLLLLLLLLLMMMLLLMMILMSWWLIVLRLRLRLVLLLMVLYLLNHVAEMVDLAGAANDVHLVVFVAEVGAQALGHTADDGADDIRVFAPVATELADFADDLVFGVATDRAGVEDNYLSLGNLGGEDIA